MKPRMFLAVLAAALCFVVPVSQSHAGEGDPLSGVVGVNLTNKAAYPVSVVFQCYYYSKYAGQEGGEYKTKTATISPNTSQKVTCCSRSCDKNFSRKEFVSCDPKTLDGTFRSPFPQSMKTLRFPDHDNTILIWNVDILPSGLNASFQLQP